MSLTKIPFLVSTALSTHVAWTPPNPPPSQNERLKNITLSEALFVKTVRKGPYMTKIMIWIVCLCEAAVIYIRRNPSSDLAKRLLQLLVPGASTLSSRHHAIGQIRLSRIFLASWLLTSLGGLVRLECYRLLGRLFTYELTIRPNHELVTTGLYSIVRHPSYTGAMLEGVGVALYLMSPGSWVQECGIWKTNVGKCLILGWISNVGYTLVNMTLRTKKEDVFLKEEFGEAWEAWARRVRYRLIPGIY
ncbi:hypothetical protein SERLA73DRAFT_144924 [Serpula lacrymans var. lacrymans S7.3]|uniref:Protein-S-isoprenylcysteine O-methyltransferase n=2 Tax=Serpula lacrymans var. lacrymans TaxID=341189 RepID=F8QCN4_SERL3|nr:uncharacterized protein SERLADRAFT_402640 [Serpula lacrymans var. lacrymans S7.9]EGN93899.1 hypothetical protein SERLA73DRAFT_144924 [Serpula lacrymans var. lacrymans S7.3]EGO19266.1 hypothetical protein SERLADRAFT_402640 [Serpula lacrymans var. lacrymans S7.9]